MIFHEEYASVPDPEVDRFVEVQELGRLVTAGRDGVPPVGLYPFVHAGDASTCTWCAPTSRSRI